MFSHPISKQWNCYHPTTGKQRIDADTRSEAESLFERFYGVRPDWSELVEAEAWGVG